MNVLLNKEHNKLKNDHEYRKKQWEYRHRLENIERMTKYNKKYWLEHKNDRTDEYMKKRRKQDRLRYKKAKELGLLKPRKNIAAIKLRYYKKKSKEFGHIFNISPRGYGHALADWSRVIKQRDNLTCVVCNTQKLNSELNAHHIFAKAKYQKLSLNLNNGITLCVSCHKELHYGVEGGFSW